MESDSYVPVTIQVPADKAERMVHAIERAACTDIIECTADEYRKRVQAAFIAHCPDKKYTGTPLDLDTLLAVLENRVIRAAQAFHKDHP